MVLGLIIGFILGALFGEPVVTYIKGLFKN